MSAICVARYAAEQEVRGAAALRTVRFFIVFALVCIAGVIEVRPSYAAARCTSSHDSDATIAACTQALRTARNNADRSFDLSTRGTAYAKKGDFERAFADFAEAIRIDPKAEAPYNNRANAYLLLGDYAQALTQINEALRNSPRSIDSLDSRAEIHVARGDFVSALADYDRAIQISPKSAFLYVSRGIALRKKKDFAKAIADFDQAIRLSKTYAAAYTGRGLSQEALGNQAQAKTDFAAALRVSKTDHFDAREHSVGWAHDTARARLASIDTAAPVVAAAPPSTTPQAAAPAPVAPTTPTTAATPAPAVVASRPAAEQPTLRVALVIGNSNYSAVPRLPNPIRDAEMVATAFRDLGFRSVTVMKNLGYDEMRRALRDFSMEVARADWGVVYYAGHGIELNGDNFLIPIDARLQTDRDAQFEAVSLQTVLASVEGAKKLKIVILDACRDNPFVNGMTRTVASRSIGRGLARVEPEGGTLVAYSAKHGQVALDGDGSNSPFVSAFVRRLSEPRVEISKFFRLLRDDVLSATNKQQEPFIYGSLPGTDFFFNEN